MKYWPTTKGKENDRKRITTNNKIFRQTIDTEYDIIINIII